MLNFFILMFILNKILYKPILSILDERDERIVGGQEETKGLLSEGQEIIGAYNQKIYDAKVEAMAVKNSARKEAGDQANLIISDARSQADEIIAEVRQKMASEIARAKKELEPELEGIAASIAEQVLGRKVA